MKRQGGSATEALARKEGKTYPGDAERHVLRGRDQPTGNYGGVRLLAILLGVGYILLTGSNNTQPGSAHHAAGQDASFIQSCISEHEDIVSLVGTPSIVEEVRESCECKAYVYRKLNEDNCGERTNSLGHMKYVQEYSEKYCEDINVYEQRLYFFYGSVFLSKPSLQAQ